EPCTTPSTRPPGEVDAGPAPPEPPALPEPPAEASAGTPLPTPEVTRPRGAASGPSVVAPMWFSNPVRGRARPSSRGSVTSSPIDRVACGEVVTSSSPRPGAREPSPTANHSPNTCIPAQIASTGTPRPTALCRPGERDRCREASFCAESSPPPTV